MGWVGWLLSELKDSREVGGPLGEVFRCVFSNLDHLNLKIRT